MIIKPSIAKKTISRAVRVDMVELISSRPVHGEKDQRSTTVVVVDVTYEEMIGNAVTEGMSKM